MRWDTHSNCGICWPPGGLPVGGTFQWGELQSQGRPWIRWRRNWKTPSRRCTWPPPRGRGWTGFCPSWAGSGGEASVEDLRATAAALLRIGGGSFTLAAMNDTPSGLRPARQGGGDGGPLEAEGDLPPGCGNPRWVCPDPGQGRGHPAPATYRWSTSSGRQSDGHAPSPPRGDGGVTMERDTSSGAQVTDRPPNFVQ